MDHDDNSFPFNEFYAIVGGKNWVIARKSACILGKYGKDVICLSPQRYKDAERLARLQRTAGLD